MSVHEAIAVLRRSPTESLHTVINGTATHVTLLDSVTVILESVRSDWESTISIDALRREYSGNDFRALQIQEYMV